jgi:arylformamidase
MAQLYDISRLVSPRLTLWPGDASFTVEPILDLKKGDLVNLTNFCMGPHTGSHIDAPWHTEKEGGDITTVPLDHTIGPAHVVTIDVKHGPITPAAFAGRDLSGVERLLIHTWNSELPDEEWPDDFPYPTPELADWLAGLGVILLGVDLPTVDAFDSTELACHHRLNHHGISIVERLILKDVPDGIYELIALPLKIEGLCGSPVRAVLRTL